MISAEAIRLCDAWAGLIPRLLEEEEGIPFAVDSDEGPATALTDEGEGREDPFVFELLSQHSMPEGFLAELTILPMPTASLRSPHRHHRQMPMQPS
jgi:hypothetical protein